MCCKLWRQVSVNRQVSDSIYANDTTLYSKCDQASDLWQQLELASELESDLEETVNWGRKWFRLAGLVALALLM